MSTPFRKIALLPLTERRLSFCELWGRYHFRSGALSIKARVPPGTIQAMLDNRPVRRIEAEKVLQQLSALLHEEFTLQMVDVEISTETEETKGKPSK